MKSRKSLLHVVVSTFLLLALLVALFSEQRQTRSTVGKIAGSIFQQYSINKLSWTEAVKPSFVIHVGPGCVLSSLFGTCGLRWSSRLTSFSLFHNDRKTATTTVQRDLARLTDILYSDNYVYLGRHKNRTHRSSRIQLALATNRCLGPTALALRKNQSAHDVPCWKHAIDEIAKWKRNNTSVILSDETMSNRESPLWDDELFNASISGLKEALRDDWNVFVVVGYRRYSEWTLSSLKQLNGIGCASDRTDWRRGYCQQPWERINEWMRRVPPSAKNFYYVDTVISKWKDIFPVKILNYHAPGYITQKFACDILPDALNTCEHTSSRSVTVDANIRSSSTGPYSSIALAAYNNRLIPKNAKRSEIVEKMEEYLDRKVGLLYRHLPFEECPPGHELEMLLNISLNFERALMPEWYQSPGGQVAHRESFWRLANEKREFCSVDVEAVVSNKTSWEEVLNYLAQRVDRNI